MTGHDQPIQRLTDVITHRPRALSLQVTYTEASHSWSAIGDPIKNPPCP